MNRFFLLLIVFSGCYRVSDEINPKVRDQSQDTHLSSLQSAFEPLSLEERHSEWGKEYVIAKGFAEKEDLYRAISTLKRAEILLPSLESNRRQEIEYSIFLCYFLGKKYQEATEVFETSLLSHVDPSFTAYQDLLLMLYECYREKRDPEKQAKVLELLQKTSPDTAEKLCLSQALRTGDFPQVKTFSEGFSGPSYLSNFVDRYELHKKSISQAQLLNAVFPGSGYYYIGQKKAAYTSFLLNTLFITAACKFFINGHFAAGLITTGFEAGWYFGGIYGAGEEAKYYNERLYEQSAENVLNDYHLFPSLMMRYTF